ncbi:two pore domain potassium channel family protein [Vibrio coralliilyticus OCN008]|uniref:potassium channel family protein n=1 Tax=Vibrio coralliilyticus TaxID=190893 RepID=UPI000390C54D|nr:potassium channel family protein [Vibrio coralliilyticus]ERB67311.1 potassium channel protein [Vibrio coralliilyticus OCN008]QIJ84494.1 two pore domain potassium channel family protein [Vibrio coralliilyticus OCN008]
MSVWFVFKKWLKSRLFQLSNRNLIILLLAYVALSWGMLVVSGETALTEDISTFIYYLMVTASTVGYGDLSPTTAAGKWVVILFVIPGGLTLFAALVGRLASASVDYWRAGILGKRRVGVENHILLLGWNGQRTMHLIRMLQHEEEGKRPIVLCSRSDIENPLPGEIGFVKVTSYTDEQEMEKASVTQASCIVVDNLEDDITLSAALYSANVNLKAHLLAYFKDEALSQLLNQHCPNAECIPAVGAEMLAKAAVDPGSSALHQELLASTRGMTQYSTTYPESASATDVQSIFVYIKRAYQATLIAIDTGKGIELNPDLEKVILPGTKLFYIADERIERIDWSKI